MISSIRRVQPAICVLLLAGISALLIGCQAITTLPQPSVAAIAAPTSTTGASIQPTSAPTPGSTPTNPPTPPPSTTSTAAPSAPASTATATGQPSRASGLASLESLSSSSIPARDLVALALQYGRTTNPERVARTTPLPVKVGDVQEFTVSDQSTNKNYTIKAKLVFALSNVLVYVEEGVDLDLSALQRSARQFNDEIYPRDRALFGSEWSPGVDGDPRLTILNARIPGVGGYFSGSDEVPRTVNRYSNEREMFYINIDSFEPGTESYGSVLAHEFQHMIEYNEQDRAATWFNEGMSQLAEELNGFTDSAANLAPAYVASPDVQLTTWTQDETQRLPHYAASYLFLSYFYQQYQPLIDLKQLTRDNAGERMDRFVAIARQKYSDIASFGDIYADWAVANLLNNRGIAAGRYAYKQLSATVQPEPLPRNGSDTVAQFGSDYWTIPQSSRERVLRFDGSDTIGLVQAQPNGKALWWSRRGDSSDSRMYRAFDLRTVSSATLQYRLWYDLEDGWDYGFVSISTDGGKTFTTLPSRYTTKDDPQGANYGNAYTGRSGGGDQPQWLDEQIDLTPYAGKQVMLRFSVITDDAVNQPGMALDDIRIPEINFRDDAETGDGGWTTEGFVRTDNTLPQQWEVRLVRTAGRATTVEPLTLDAQNVGEVRLKPNEQGTLIVMATTPQTTERASYTISLK